MFSRIRNFIEGVFLAIAIIWSIWRVLRDPNAAAKLQRIGDEMTSDIRKVTEDAVRD